MADDPKTEGSLFDLNRPLELEKLVEAATRGALRALEARGGEALGEQETVLAQQASEGPGVAPPRSPISRDETFIGVICQPYHGPAYAPAPEPLWVGIRYPTLKDLIKGVGHK